MDCPVCSYKMESEGCPVVQFPHPSIPSAHYRCETCDAEYVWLRGEKLRLIDSA